MITNPSMPGCINQWEIGFDSYGFVLQDNWLESAEKTEDILQLQHVYADGPILDVGWYNGVYRLVIVLGHDWKNPVEIIESTSAKKVSDAVYALICRYSNGV